MDELKTNTKITSVTLRNISHGTVTIIETANRLKYIGQIGHETGTIVSSNVYETDQTYKLIYSFLDDEGQVIGTYEECEGILPTFFKSPQNDIWVSLVPYDPDKEMEISIPIFRRSLADLPKPNRPFTGDFIGTIDNSSYFISVDNFSIAKPDKFLRLEFKDGKLKKRHSVRITAPSQNEATVSNNQIHLLARGESILTHRTIDYQGELLKQRQILANTYDSLRIISLSFTETSQLIATRKDTVYLITITPDGRSTEVALLQTGSDFYNLWGATQLSDCTYLFRFTNENGNGWFVIRENTILECFVRVSEQYYNDIISSETIDLGFKNLILAGVNKTKDNCFALTYYAQSENHLDKKSLIVLNRGLK